MATAIRFAGEGPGPQSLDGCSVELFRRIPATGEPEIVASVVPAGGRILELGSGPGRVTASCRGGQLVPPQRSRFARHGKRFPVSPGHLAGAAGLRISMDGVRDRRGGWAAACQNPVASRGLANALSVVAFGMATAPLAFVHSTVAAIGFMALGGIAWGPYVALEASVTSAASLSTILRELSPRGVRSCGRPRRSGSQPVVCCRSSYRPKR